MAPLPSPGGLYNLAVLMPKHLFANHRPLGTCNSCPPSSCHTLCHLGLCKPFPQSALHKLTRPPCVPFFILKGLVRRDPLPEALSWRKPWCGPDTANSQMAGGCRCQTLRSWGVKSFDGNLSPVESKSLELTSEDSGPVQLSPTCKQSGQVLGTE